ncbi:MAG: hypothetical protein HZB39_00350 [Planctomycetes bacterium]|nr:hypothetical protein [Planctomycetota bacterium]
MGLVLLFVWAAHIGLVTVPGTAGAAILWRRGRATPKSSFWSIAASTAIVALGLRIAYLVYGYRDIQRIGHFEAHVDLLFSKAVIATWCLGLAVVVVGLLLSTRRLDAVAAGLCLSLAVQLPLAMFSSDVFTALGVELTY